MNKKLCIAVSGLNATDNPGPGIPVARSLRESEAFSDAKIIGLAYENLEPGIYMPGIVNKTYQVPYPSVGSENLLQRIEYIHEQENIQVIIPNFDAELHAFITNEKRLNDKGIATFLPTLQQYEERHKANLPAFGKKHNVLVPKSITIASANDIHKIRKEFVYPVLIKGKFYDAYVAFNEEQALMHFNKISSKWGVPVIVQEFIRGTEVNVIALGDGKGNTYAAVPMRKLYITDKGKAWSGISIDDDKLLKLTYQIIDSTKWRGGMELELIKTNDNKYYLLEINPRIPAWVYFAVGVGQNIPETLVKLALNMPAEPFTTYNVGTMFIRYSWDLIVPMEQFQILSTTGELEKN
ncbi:MAG: ATP-grasp domain-containing protein [Bacteroidales bacterium]|nr:ATP-grasp domain-containing protein [Bacteroidales bacterium]